MRKIEHPFSVGSKSLELFQFSTDPTNTFRGDIKTTSGPRVPGETTEIYRQVGEYLFQLSENLNDPVRYVFSTDNENLIKWAQTKAPWKWDRVELRHGMTAEVTFERQKN